MKIQLVSDLHLEFGEILIPNNGADTLILSGDITVANELLLKGTASKVRGNVYNRTIALFDQVCKDFKNVIYVLGNHEHYHGDYPFTIRILTNTLGHHSNLHILDVSCVDIDGILFVGGTLWTDFNRNSPIVKWNAMRIMNDYRIIINSHTNRKFNPDDAYAYHQKMLDYIDAVYQKQIKNNDSRPIIIVGHHAPSTQSIQGRYVGDKLNGAYASDLSEFILDRPQIKMWTHGHVHTSFDYMIGTCRVVCNPRGYYSYEENNTFNSGSIWEI